MWYHKNNDLKMIAVLFTLIYLSSSFTQEDAVCDFLDSVKGLYPSWNCSSAKSACSWSIFRCSFGNIIEVRLTTYITAPWQGAVYPVCNGCVEKVFKFPSLNTLIFTGGGFGSITNISKVTMLKYLQLQGSGVTGTIPTQIGRLTRLTSIIIDKTMMSGSIPSEINSFADLTYLRIIHNRFSGNIPPLDRTKVKYLNLAFNDLSGTLSKRSLITLGGLTYVDITRNSISGSIPSGLQVNSVINTFLAAANKLSGPINLISGYNLSVIILDLSVNMYSDGDVCNYGYNLVTQNTNIIDLSGNRYNNTNLRCGSPKILKTVPQDFDECSTGLYNCPVNGYCSDGWNPYMYYTCSCNIGYKMVGDTCQDINECDLGACNNKEKCINTNGSYYCCETGFMRSLSGDKCVDIDECSSGLWVSKCTSANMCINKNGTFECCMNGFIRSLQQEECIDYDECMYGYKKGDKECYSKSACINTWGSYNCCDVGFTAYDGICVDINECNDPSVCGSRVDKCVNINGSYYCCEDGYRSIGGICTDIDECLDINLNKCSDRRACVNTIGSYRCCQEGYRNIDGLCQDINECIEFVSVCDGRQDACINTNGSYKCCKSEEYAYERRCTECFTDYETIASNNTPFVILRDYVKKGIIFNHMKCIGECTNSISISVRKSLSGNCKGEVFKQEICQKPCIDVTDAGLESLKNEFMKNGFLQDILSKVLGLNVNVNITETDHAKRNIIKETKLDISLYPCGNQVTSRMIEIINVIYGLSNVIAPNIPMLKHTYRGCDVNLSSTSKNTGLIVALSLMGLIVLIFMILAIYWWYIVVTNNLNHLPSDVARSYKTKDFRWKFKGNSESGYSYRDIERSDELFSKILSYIKDSDKMEDMVDRITLVYNKTLTDNFIGTYLIQKSRMKNSSNIFFSRKWDVESGEKNKMRRSVFDHYRDLCTGYEWNKEDNVSIIPVCHGTDLAIAEKICETGFASLSSLDQGWYGKGIYFSSYSLYCSPYIVSRRQPSIIFGWLLPGNTYPVTESHNSDDTLIGSALKAGYQSHYIAVDKKGHVNPDDDERYNEIVVGQESQIVPAAILHINPDKMSQITSQWIKE